MRDEAEIVNHHADSYLFHEHLEEVNEPCYFHELVERARSVGLQYLAEADFRMMLADDFDQETARILQGAPLLRREQYMDFLRNRMFRATLLCHAGVQIDRTIVATRLKRCHVSLDERLPLQAGTLDSAEPLSLDVGNETITASRPVTKAALLVLNDIWPAAIALDELYDAALAHRAIASRPGGSAEVLRKPGLEILASDLMTLYAHEQLRAQVDPPPITAHPGDCPQATPLACLQARHGNLVTNRRHELLRLTDLSRAVLSRLDGRHNRRSLADWLAGAFARGEFTVEQNDRVLKDIDQATLEQVLDGSLGSLADSALVIA